MKDYERAILEAIDRLGDNAYGVPLREIVGGSYGQLYTALERLEERGLITSREGEATPERGMRRKRYYRRAAS